MKTVQLILVILILGFLVSCAEKVIYTSPSGSDSNSGSLSKPVATIQHAIELSRSESIKQIVVGEGKYFEVAITISAADSGLIISGENEKVFLYGGKEITGWKPEGKYLVADVPGTKNRKWDFRLLTMNDSLRSRARIPETGGLQHLNKWPHKWLSAQGGWSQKPTNAELTTLNYRAEDFTKTPDGNNAELTVFHMWDDSYVSIKNIDTLTHAFVYNYPATHPAGAFEDFGCEKATKYVVWNTREGMKQPGQWYLDRSNEKLVYWPLPYEKAENLKATVPVSNRVISIQKGSKNIRLANLNISCSGAPLSNTGYGAYMIDGALVADSVENLSLEKVNVRNTSGWAIKVEGKKIAISKSELSNCYAGGITYKGDYITIKSCGVHDVGKLYYGATGITGEGKYNTVANCELYNLTYAGINGLGSKSVAENNLIYNFKTMLEDGGAFYCYGGDSTVYRNNAVIMPASNTREGWTYYFDEQSKNCIAENNLAVNTISPVHNHMASNIVMRNNVFIDKQVQNQGNLLCSNVEFSNNLFLAPEIVFQHASGEKISQPIESFNKVFQKYYQSNGVTVFKGNQLYCTTAKHNVLHMYVTNRTVPMPMEGNSISPYPESPDAILNEVYKRFASVGYRNNFNEIINQNKNK